MSWKCPECGNSNKDYMGRCVCGYDFDSGETNLETKLPEKHDGRSQGAEQLYQEAYALWEIGKKEELIEVCSRLLEEFPDSKQAKWALKNFKIDLRSIESKKRITPTSDKKVSIRKDSITDEKIFETEISDRSRLEVKSKYWHRKPTSWVGFLGASIFILPMVISFIKAEGIPIPFFLPFILIGLALIIRSFGPRPGFGKGIALIFGNLFAGSSIIRILFLEIGTRSDNVTNILMLILGLILIWLGFKR